MAKKSVASLQTGSKRLSKAIKMVKSPKTGAYTFVESIMDPKKGTVYDCKLWIEGGNLKVRGYVLFIYRTQTWLPYKE